jgi:hypothetical protein
MTAIAVDWPTAIPALGLWFETVTGLRAEEREGPQKWGGSLKKAAPKHAYGQLHLVEGRWIGWPAHEKRQNLGAPQGEEITPHVTGIREVVWEVRVRSRNNTAGLDAASYLRKVEAHLHDPGPDGFTILASSLGLGLQDSEGIVDLTTTIKKRRISIAQLDVKLHAYTDEAMKPYGYVDTLVVKTEWRDAGGALLPPNQQFEGEIP